MPPQDDNPAPTDNTNPGLGGDQPAGNQPAPSFGAPTPPADGGGLGGDSPTPSPAPEPPVSTPAPEEPSAPPAGPAEPPTDASGPIIGQ